MWLVHENEAKHVRAYPTEYTFSTTLSGRGVWWVDGIGNVHEREFFDTREAALDAKIAILKDMLMRLLSALQKLDAQRSERSNDEALGAPKEDA